MQLSHKLLIRCMGALKSGVKSGNAEHKATGDNEGMVKALVELASFCDEQLRLKEDEGITYIIVLVHNVMDICSPIMYISVTCTYAFLYFMHVDIL